MSPRAIARALRWILAALVLALATPAPRAARAMDAVFVAAVVASPDSSDTAAGARDETAAGARRVDDARATRRGLAVTAARGARAFRIRRACAVPRAPRLRRHLQLRVLLR